MQHTQVETIGQLREQLAWCQAELGKAVEQLLGAEEKLQSVGDEMVTHIQTTRTDMENSLSELKSALVELNTIDGDEPLRNHQDKLAEVASLLQAFAGFQERG